LACKKNTAINNGKIDQASVASEANGLAQSLAPIVFFSVWNMGCFGAAITTNQA